jgi:hypothetical protein
MLLNTPLGVTLLAHFQTFLEISTNFPILVPMQEECLHAQLSKHFLTFSFRPVSSETCFCWPSACFTGWQTWLMQFSAMDNMDFYYIAG